MGLWNFVKDAGKSLFGSDDTEPQADKLKQELEGLGINTADLQLEVEGDAVRVTGPAADQETREKTILALGNVEGVASVEADVPDQQPTFHTVEKGDSLWKIAERTLGNGTHYQAIFEANRPMLSDPDKIYPGQQLRIPTL